MLVYGESGTGKELVARTIHELSNRRNKPFVAINCAAIPETLIESELFGHERGAFTGATERRLGCFELADGGTLFLDEIAEMDSNTQAKLLRVLQEGTFRRVGGGKHEIQVDVRVVAATNRVPTEAITNGKLREDLFYRLNVFSIHLPPLRERREDVPLLARTFIEEFNRQDNRQVRGLSQRGREGAGALPLARQRARAAQRHPAGGGAERHRPHRGRAPARQRAAGGGAGAGRRRRPPSRRSARWSAT